MGKRLIPQRRGRGTPTYRSPSHRHVDDVRLPAIAEGTAVIKDLIQAPGRTSPLAVLDLNGRTDYQLAVEGTKVGQTIIIGGNVVAAGNITKLSLIPEGTLVHNVEARPGDGGKFIKTAGSSGTVVSRGDKVNVLLPSGVIKEFSPDCRAVIGVIEEQMSIFPKAIPHFGAKAFVNDAPHCALHRRTQRLSLFFQHFYHKPILSLDDFCPLFRPRVDLRALVGSQPVLPLVVMDGTDYPRKADML